MNYEQVYNKIVQDLEDYVKQYNLKSLVLGISGGIDSTVCAAICREVCDRVDIPLIGRSLPIKNKGDEFGVSKLVGQTFCDDFKVSNLNVIYQEYLKTLIEVEQPLQTPIANGNIQARLRMIYLYNLASIHNGIVIDTDNLTENNLGFFTIHGDQGDYKPIIGLWKIEVYELAEWINNSYYTENNYHRIEPLEETETKSLALSKSIALTPTDGLGISNSDLEQIGAESYDNVDKILQTLLPYGYKTTGMICSTSERGIKDVHDLYTTCGGIVVDKVWNRHLNSQFKRNSIPGTYKF